MKTKLNLHKVLYFLFFLILISNNRLSAKDSTNSISQYGITWTFDKNYRYGQFVNGDYWVLGPVTIVSITPASVVVAAQNNRIINGSMLNPAVSLWQGYDKMMVNTDGRCWDSSLNVARPGGNDLSVSNPLIINTPSSLASAISREVPEEGMNVLTIAVLTILNEAPPENAFRPPFVGSGNKNITHTLSDVNRNLLPKLAVPASVYTTVEEVSALFEKPWVEHMQDWQKESFCPPGNMHAYGREIATDVSNGALMLLLDVDSAAREVLLIRMIQLGLDYYGQVISPNGRIAWKADGGHMSGRAFPLIFAGYMLNDQSVLDVMKKSGQYAYQNGYYEGNLPSDYIHFGEIDQTFYITQRDVNRTHLPEWSPDPRGNTPTPYETGDIGLAEWGINHVHSPLGDNKAWEATYRRVNTPPWCGFILASHILGIKDLWNHPPLFDYVGRWVAAGEEPGQVEFHKQIWEAYGDDFPLPSVIKPVNCDNFKTITYPNPFTQSTTITYTLPETQHVNIIIYDFTGRQVAVLLNGWQDAGSHSAIFDAASFDCLPGIYLFKIESGTHQSTGKLILIK